MTAPDLPPYAAVVLTGGRASRLGGADKPALVVGGRSLGARVVEAAAGAARVVVVGAPVPGVEVDLVVREEPPGGGPVAALAAGVVAVAEPVTAALAGDLPFLDAPTVLALRSALAAEPDAAAALLVDDTGRDQLLCAVWRTSALRSALAAVGGPAGVPLRAVLAAAGRVVRVAAGRQDPPPWFDCDTEEDLASARAWQGGRRK